MFFKAKLVFALHPGDTLPHLFATSGDRHRQPNGC